MKINKFSISLIINICSLIACGPKEDTAVELDSSDIEPHNLNTHVLEPRDTVKIAIDERTSNTTTCMLPYYDKQGTEFLAFLNRMKPAVQIYDLVSGTLSKEIVLSQDGPNGVGRPSGFEIINFDSILIVSSYDYKLSIVDSSGQLKRSYNLIEGGRGEDTGMPRVYTASPLRKINDIVYMNIAPDRNVYSPIYFEGKTMLLLNLQNSELAYINNYPRSFQDNVWGVMNVNYSTAYLEDLFIFSFGIESVVRTFNPLDSTTGRYYAGSDRVGKIEPMKKWDMSLDLKYALETNNYAFIVYDKYRSVFYRFVNHSISYLDQATKAPNDYFDKPFSVVILNSRFEKIGESYFPGKIYQNNNFFVGKEGLYVSNCNNRNPDLDEDHISFTQFSLVENTSKQN